MKRLFAILLTGFLAVLGLSAQERRSSSVVSDEQLSARRINLQDSLPGDLFVDSMAATRPKVVGNVYPLLHELNIGLDVWPAINRAFQSHYGLGALWVKLSLHNRYFPAFEAGVSNASYTPRGMNFSFHSPIAPYFKVGMDYNFLYNSNPDYKIYIGVRYGISAFSYQFRNVTLSSGYWDTSETIDFPSQRSVSGYFEAAAGLQVKLGGPISAGWSFCWHHVIHHNAEPYGSPWVVPGFGVRSNALGITVSLIYTIPIHSVPKTPVNEANSESDE